MTWAAAWLTIASLLAGMPSGWGNERGPRRLLAATPAPRTSQNSTATLTVQYGKAAALGQFPYMVALYAGESPFCSGTLIHPSVVLTAGHCSYDVGYKQWLPLTHLRIGAVDSFASATGGRAGVQRTYRRRVVHRKYDGNIYDLSLIFLNEPVNEYQPVGLAAAGSRVQSWRALTVTGYGYWDNDQPSYSLRTGTVQKVPLPQCLKWARYLLDLGPLQETLMCAGYTATSTDVCAGDSGGPLLIWNQNVAKHVQVGLVHGGKDCGSSDYPIGSYTTISSTRTWIDAMVAKYKDLTGNGEDLIEK